MKFAFPLKNSLSFDTFYSIFFLEAKTLQLSNLKTKKAMNVKFSVVIIHIKAVICSES